MEERAAKYPLLETGQLINVPVWGDRLHWLPVVEDNGPESDPERRISYLTKGGEISSARLANIRIAEPDTTGLPDESERGRLSEAARKAKLSIRENARRRRMAADIEAAEHMRRQQEAKKEREARAAEKVAERKAKIAAAEEVRVRAQITQAALEREWQANHPEENDNVQ